MKARRRQRSLVFGGGRGSWRGGAVLAAEQELARSRRRQRAAVGDAAAAHAAAQQSGRRGRTPAPDQAHAAQAAAARAAAGADEQLRALDSDPGHACALRRRDQRPTRCRVRRRQNTVPPEVLDLPTQGLPVQEGRPRRSKRPLPVGTAPLPTDDPGSGCGDGCRVSWHVRSVMRDGQAPPGGLDLWAPVPSIE